LIKKVLERAEKSRQILKEERKLAEQYRETEQRMIHEQTKFNSIMEESKKIEAEMTA
jgi:hypothetical protein